MKKTISILIVAFLVLSATCTYAAEKIGFINMKQVLLLSDAGKGAAGEFQKVFEKSKAKIQAREAELKKRKENLEKQRLVLKESAMKEKELEYQKDFRDYRRLVEDSNADIKRMDQELSRNLIPVILKVVNTIGKEEGYTMILDFNAAGVAYHSKAKDITKKVIKEFNKAYKPKK